MFRCADITHSTAMIGLHRLFKRERDFVIYIDWPANFERFFFLTKKKFDWLKYAL